MAKEPFKQLVGMTRAAVKAGERVEVDLYSNDPDPDKRQALGEKIEVPSNLDVAAERWCVINDFRGVPTICAADLTPAEDHEAA